MIIEFDLQGSQMSHKGVFETTSFWAKYDKELCDVTKEVLYYKIYSHFSFTFEHEEEWVAKSVYKGLCSALTGCDFVLDSVGFIREVV
jgi:hypothetical protein